MGVRIVKASLVEVVGVGEGNDGNGISVGVAKGKALLLVSALW